jgi:hypothetical protein
MRMLALAAMIGVGLFVGAAEAREYRDPAGRIVFDAPANWPVTVEEAPASVTYLIAGNDDNECRFLVTVNAGSASTSPYNSWRTGRNDVQFTDAVWIDLAHALPRLFPAPATVISRTRDDQGFWPVQRALLNSPGRSFQVYAGMQLRPGIDMLGFCVNYDGEPPLQTFDSVLRSMAHPNDATWRAAAEEQIAARAAAEATAAAPAPAPPPEEQRRRRN